MITEKKLKVLTFSKEKYEREELEKKNELEKYITSYKDNRYCNIYDAEEYTKRLNDFIPMERYVYTYIVSVYSNE